ncbi:MAG: hypothetical protein GXP45_01195 [bacterium]|nr:hypothetical protein [bacterium]
MIYNPSISTTRNVISSITGTDIIVLNNSGSLDYIFTGNGIFTYVIQDMSGNTETVDATVDWIT